MTKPSNSSFTIGDLTERRDRQAVVQNERETAARDLIHRWIASQCGGPPVKCGADEIEHALGVIGWTLAEANREVADLRLACEPDRRATIKAEADRDKPLAGDAARRAAELRAEADRIEDEASRASVGRFYALDDLTTDRSYQSWRETRARMIGAGYDVPGLRPPEPPQHAPRRVRALVDVYIDDIYRPAGDEFYYVGPDAACLQVIEDGVEPDRTLQIEVVAEKLVISVPSAVKIHLQKKGRWADEPTTVVGAAQTLHRGDRVDWTILEPIPPGTCLVRHDLPDDFDLTRAAFGPDQRPVQADGAGDDPPATEPVDMAMLTRSAFEGDDSVEDVL